ncbi:unnamed protein product [Paramecium sonneborni]|uniref:Uncharacterized protein n=1 Tax=Paramecium sonneborni TaxID=65129 RepID=A0A8S1RMA3_9CILI|nr:unnamed protein product [Paramecium sonneborni]
MDSAIIDIVWCGAHNQYNEHSRKPEFNRLLIIINYITLYKQQQNEELIILMFIRYNKDEIIINMIIRHLVLSLQNFQTQSLSKCINYYSNLQKFAEIVDKYFTTENKLVNYLNIIIFNTYQLKLQKVQEKTFNNYRYQKNILNIQRERQRFLLHKIPLNRRVHYEL